MEDAHGLVGCKLICLRALPDMPRNDWDEEIVVDKVLSVDPTPSAPNGALHFYSREGGFRCIPFYEVVEVVGEMGRIQTRPEPKPTRRKRQRRRRASV